MTQLESPARLEKIVFPATESNQKRRLAFFESKDMNMECELWSMPPMPALPSPEDEKIASLQEEVLTLRKELELEKIKTLVANQKNAALCAKISELEKPFALTFSSSDAEENSKATGKRKRTNEEIDVVVSMFLLEHLYFLTLLNVSFSLVSYYSAGRINK